MNKNENSSLLTRNRVANLSQADQLQVNDYIEVARSFARLTYQSVYIIDYENMSFDYVSDNPLFLSGHTASEVMKLGYEFYFQNVPEHDLTLLNQLNEAGFNFFDKLPVIEKKEYTITYDFHLINKEGQHILINHKLTPLFLTSNGKMWKSICIVSMSHNQKAGNVYIYKHDSDDRWELDTTHLIWKKSIKPKLSERETEVLRLHAQGLTINQIAEKIFVVPDTVKYYRRRIFERLQVNNMVEALAYAVSSKLI